METNLYDQPAQARFLNTYVPINFGELYRIGAAQKEVVDQAQRELSGNLQKWSEFQSPSAVDTQKYYDLTINKLAPTIQELSSNPDLIKTAAGRSQLQSMINSVDYRSLSNLRQSRDAMLSRQKANQELMMKGLFNPMWHDVDFQNYDTLGSNQIFNDVSPLAYKSEVDLVEPFVNNLKDSFITSRNGYEWYGVTPEQTRQQVDSNLSSILNTPYAQKHIQVLQQQGLTPQQALETFTSNVYRAAEEQARVNRKEDSAYWERQKLAAKADKDAGGIQNLTSILDSDARKLFLQNFSGLDSSRLRDITSGKDKLTADEQRLVNSNLDPNVIRGKIKGYFDDVLNQTRDRNKATEAVLNVMSSSIGDEATDILASNGTTTKLGKNAYMANDLSSFTRAEDLAYNMMGTTRANYLASKVKSATGKTQSDLAATQVARDRFDKDLLTPGRFHDVLVEGQPRITTDGTNMYHVKSVYIPKKQLYQAGYTSEQVRSIGSIIAKGNVKNKFERAITDSYTWNSGDETFEADDTKMKVVQRQIDDSEGYLKVDMVTLIPTEGERSISNDTKYNKGYGISAKLKDIQAAMSQQERM